MTTLAERRKQDFFRAKMEAAMPKGYVYLSFEPGLFTVGFYDPIGKWHPESDHESRDAAASRVHYLNGGGE